MEFSDKDYREIFSKVPRVCIDLILASQEGIIFAKRSHSPFKDLYALPGGRMKFGESFLEAAKRIGKEEVGVDVEVFSVVDAMEFPEEIDTHNQHSISIAGACIYKGKPTLKSKHFTDIKYLHELDKDQILNKHYTTTLKF